MSKNTKSILGIITARSGSKRLVGKNMKMLGGQTLLARSIDVGLRCPSINHLIVNTDDTTIAEHARDCGAEIPFIRPQVLAGDAVSSMDVIEHTLNYYEHKGQSWDAIVLLQPTSPLRTEFHIEGAIDKYLQLKANAVVSVCAADDKSVYWNELDSNLRMQDFLKNTPQSKRPDKKYYALNGAIYIAGWEYIQKNKDWYSSRTYAYVMDQESSVDIDTNEDWIIAKENLYKRDSKKRTRMEACSELK